MSKIGLYSLLSAIFLCSCNTKKSKSDIPIAFTQDTLSVGYTYWWVNSEPFARACFNEFSLVFQGKITALGEQNDDPGPLYTSQRGIVELDRVFRIKALENNTYTNEKFFTTDCFFDSNLSVGDRVLVFCYDYEGAYSIPGKECILKLKNIDDPLVASVRKYIDSDDNLMALQEDIELWRSRGLASVIESSIETCGEAAE